MATTRHMGPILHHSLSLISFFFLQFLNFLTLSFFCLFCFVASLYSLSLSNFGFLGLFLCSLSFVVLHSCGCVMITELEMERGELELGLGLSLGGGTTAAKTGKPAGGGGGAWGERGRLLTAKDFPSVGSKRAADSASSPPRSSQVVGWPPIGSHRMNSLVNSQATKSEKEEEEEEEAGKKKAKDDKTKDVTKKAQVGFIKVNMDGVAIGRKVDLNAHSSYENLAKTLEDMFFRASPGTIGLTGQFTKPLRLLDGSSEFVLTYEDKEGDWMLVGDVPWRMFITSVKRLRVMKTSEANGLAARHQQPNERQRNHPV